MHPVIDNIDQTLDARWDDIVAAQSVFFTANGRYAQLLPTHSAVPQDGAFVAPDRASYSSAQDAIEAWNDLGSLPETMQSCLRIDNYGGPLGQGCVVVLQVVLDGQLWEKAIAVGPESERSHDWKEVEA